MATFYTKKLFMLPWQLHVSQLNHKKNQRYLLLTCLLPFLATEGSRVREKKVNETQKSKTVFSHLNKWASHLAIFTIIQVDGSKKLNRFPQVIFLQACPQGSMDFRDV